LLLLVEVRYEQVVEGDEGLVPVEIGGGQKFFQPILLIFVKIVKYGIKFACLHNQEILLT
jgi:hypothetical protein